MKVYPTVVNDFLVIDNGGQETIEASLTSVTGQELIVVNNLVHNTQVDLSELSTGVYVLRLDIAGEVHSVRVVKQ